MGQCTANHHNLGSCCKQHRLMRVLRHLCDLAEHTTSRRVVAHHSQQLPPPASASKHTCTCLCHLLLQLLSAPRPSCCRPAVLPRPAHTHVSSHLCTHDDTACMGKQVAATAAGPERKQGSFPALECAANSSCNRATRAQAHQLPKKSPMITTQHPNPAKAATCAPHL